MGTLQNREILRLISFSSGSLQRAMMMLGIMPRPVIPAPNAGWAWFVLAGALNIGHQRDMHEQAVMAANLQETWRIASRKGWLSISPVVPPISVMTTSASVFAYGVDEVFDFIGNMRDHLNGFAQIVAVSLFGQHVPVHFSGGQIGKFVEVFVNKPFIMARSRSVSAPSSVTNTSPC